DQGCRAHADAALLSQVAGAFCFVVGLGRDAVADHAAVDRAAIGARHHAALGQVAQILAHGLRAHAEAVGEPADLDASLLADEFADLEASLTGIASSGHLGVPTGGEIMPHFVVFRY